MTMAMRIKNITSKQVITGEKFLTFTGIENSKELNAGNELFDFLNDGRLLMQL